MNKIKILAAKLEKDKNNRGSSPRNKNYDSDSGDDQVSKQPMRA